MTKKIFRILISVTILCFLGCAKEIQYPNRAQDASEEALLRNVSLYLMYEFNNTPKNQQEEVSLLPISSPFDGNEKARLQTIGDVTHNFRITIEELTTTRALVLIDSLGNKTLYNWGPLGTAMAQEWHLHEGVWKYVGNPKPFYGWDDQ